jgi:L-2-hydroxycarboxylate dehydrogenase (NAD+)
MVTIIAPEALRDFMTDALIAAGALPSHAAATSEVLLYADLGGIDSHGVARLRRYVDGLAQGTINPAPAVAKVVDASAVGVIDADNGLGQPTACCAVDWAIEKAAAYGAGLVLVRRSNHFGAAGYYARRAAQEGMVTFAMTNASPQVTPTHGAQPMYGTNPIAVGIPTASDEPFVFDAATSAVPRGRLERLEREGGSMRKGWAIDPEGRDVTDIADLVQGLKARAGYALLPLGGVGEEQGGHKGFGLGVVIELLTGPLAGAASSKFTYQDGEGGLGHFFLCLRAEAVRDLPEFQQEANAILMAFRDARRLHEEVPVRVPNDRRIEAAEHRRAEGIPLRSSVVADLDRIAEEVAILRPSYRDEVPA